MPDGTPVPTADAGPRILAALIDAVLAFVVGFIPVIGGLAAAAYWVVRDGLEVSFMDHRSLGKKVMNLRPVTSTGGPVDLATSVRRNWMLGLGGVAQLLLFIPFVGWLLVLPVALAALAIGIVELILVLSDGRRWGDRLADTRVVPAEPVASRPAASAGPTAAAGLVFLALLAGCAPENGAPGLGDDVPAASGAGAAAAEPAAAGRAAATESGRFEVTFSGRREGSLSGEARFYHMNLGLAQPVPRIVLYDVRGPDDYFYIHLQPSLGSAPDEGTYPASAFQKDGFMTAAMEMKGSDLWLLAAEAEGTVTLTEASDGRMAGSFTLREPREGGATLEGTFEAPLSSMDEIPEPVR